MTGKAIQRVSRNAGFLFLGTSIKLVFSFGFVIFVARDLGAVGFGQFALAQHYFDLFLSLCATGLGILVTREIAKDSQSLGVYLSSSLLLVVALTVAACVPMLIIAFSFGYSAETKAAICVSIVALFPATIGMILEAAFIGLERAEYVTIGTLGESALRAGLGILALLTGYGLIALFLALVASRLIMLTFYAICLWREFRPEVKRVDRSLLTKLVSDWKVFAAENWCSNLNSSVGVVLLSVFHGESMVGLFVAASKVLRLGRVLAQSYTTAIFPYMARLSNESNEGFRKLNTFSVRLMICSILPPVVAISVFSDRIIQLLYGSEYDGSIVILRILAWVLALQFVNPYLSFVLFANGRPGSSMTVAVVRLLAFSVACLVLIPPYSGVGAAVAAVIGSSVAFGAYFLFAIKNVSRALATDLTLTLIAGLTLTLFLWHFKDQPIAYPLVSGCLLYVALLFALRVVTLQDVQMICRRGA